MVLAILVFLLVAGAVGGGYVAVAHLPQILEGRRLEKRLREVSLTAVDAPVLSPGRVTTMSMRPLLSSTWLLNAGVTPPCRMNVPSCTVRMRINAGL